MLGCVCACACVRATMTLNSCIYLFYFRSTHASYGDWRDGDHYIMFHKQQQDNYFAPLLYTGCHCSTLTLIPAEFPKCGYVHKLAIVCSHCKYRRANYSSPQISSSDAPSRQSYEVIHCSVLAAREVGLGQGEIVKMLALMNIKGGLHQKIYQSINHQILGKLFHGPGANNMKQTHSIVHSKYNIICGPCDGPRDITVSFDGSWYIKGRSSTMGACYVIDTMSALV